MTDPKRDALIVFARDPIVGAVKQRLAADIGSEGALAVYERLLARTLRLARSFTRHDSSVGHHCRLIISALSANSACTTVPTARLSQFSAHANAHLQEQRGDDLGDRMRIAIADALHQGAERVVLIGADCPDLSHADLRAAFGGLIHADLVMSPTRDGGYGLIGSRINYRAVFDAMPWGTDQVARLTRERADAGGKRLVQLRIQDDIDYAQDWQAWQARRASRNLPEHQWHSFKANED